MPNAWLRRWGFAALVAMGAALSAYAAWRVDIPQPIPDFALQSEAIYRVEIGAGTFLGLYLVAMAFVLALNNRGFSEIGVNGLKAQDMANRAQQTAIQSQEESIETLEQMIGEIVNSTEESTNALQQRLNVLEEKSERITKD